MDSKEFTKGNFFFRNKDYRKAVISYLKCIDANPNFYHYHMNLASAYKQLGLEHEESIAEATGNQIKAKNSENLQHNAEKKIKPIRTKLLSLGFTHRPLVELKTMAEESRNPCQRGLAARELALWHMRAKTDDDYRIALDWIDRARPDVPDQDFRAKLSTVELLCHYHLNNHAAGLAAYERAALTGEATPDLLFARVNFETTPERRVTWINQVLARYGIEHVNLLPDSGQPAYDRLTCAMALPKITGGPKVTVLIAAYDAADMLPTALRSLQEQTWANLEIIVLDDCSPSMETVEVAEQFAATDPRIQVVSMAENGGAYVARNHGLDMATGEFVTIHDADDWSHPKKIETQVHFMIKNPDITGCTTQQARICPDLQVTRWSGKGIFLFTNTSSFLFRKEPMRESLGYWDNVRFAADNELIRRMKKKWGEDCVVNIKSGPLSFQRDSGKSIVADEVLGINGQPFGVRRQYVQAQQAHHKTNNSLKYQNSRNQRPFPVPKLMLASKEAYPKPDHFDFILASEFRLLGGNSHSNAQELKCNKRAGLRSAIYPLYRYDVNENVDRPIQPEVWNEVDGDRVEILTYGQTVSCDLLVIRYPPVLNEFCRYTPNITAKEIKVIINQPPMSDYGPKGVTRYDLEKCSENIRRYFGKEATWHPIGPLVRKALQEHHAEELHCIKLSNDNWHNIIDIKEWDRGSIRPSPHKRLRIGRHSRDHEHKWPDRADDILAAYPDRKDVDVHVLGGSKTPNSILGYIPQNWIVHNFGSIHPRDFLREIDIWIYFANPFWVESFGRTIIEAMAVGVPVILPEDYRPLFKRSALYATPQTALDIARNLHADPAAYEYQTSLAKDFVKNNFSYQTHLRRIKP
jgi:glycosyltransferase involved in cell wall biosynthesis